MFVSTKIVRSGDLGGRVRCNVGNVGKCAFFFRLDTCDLNRATSAIKCVFLSDTPFDHTQLSHNLTVLA